MSMCRTNLSDVSISILSRIQWSAPTTTYGPPERTCVACPKPTRPPQQEKHNVTSLCSNVGLPTFFFGPRPALHLSLPDWAAQGAGGFSFVSGASYHHKTSIKVGRINDLRGNDSIYWYVFARTESTTKPLSRSSTSTTFETMIICMYVSIRTDSFCFY